ncbi:MAG: hypothetical protein ACLS4Z_07380 [Christensenellaceae bacterium]
MKALCPSFRLSRGGGELKSAGIRSVLTIEDQGLLEMTSRLGRCAAGVKMFVYRTTKLFPAPAAGRAEALQPPRGGGAAGFTPTCPPARRRIFELADMAALRVPLVASHCSRDHLPPQAQFNRRQIKTLARLGSVVGQFRASIANAAACGA